MARGVNKVILVGNLGRDPEVRQTNGGAVANITVATSETWKDKNTGQPMERTEWHRVVFFRRLAEIVGEYLKKGSKVYIEGKLQTRKWQDQNGQDRYSTEIVANELQMLDSRRSNTAGGQHSTPADNPAPAAHPAPAAAAHEMDGGNLSVAGNGDNGNSGNGMTGGGLPTDFDDDIPFCPRHHLEA